MEGSRTYCFFILQNVGPLILWLVTRVTSLEVDPIPPRDNGFTGWHPQRSLQVVNANNDAIFILFLFDTPYTPFHSRVHTQKKTPHPSNDTHPGPSLMTNGYFIHFPFGWPRLDKRKTTTWLVSLIKRNWILPEFFFFFTVVTSPLKIYRHI